MKQNQKDEEVSVKKAVEFDIAQIVFRTSSFIDPAPGVFIPLTRLVIGKKMLKGVYRLADKAASLMK